MEHENEGKADIAAKKERINILRELVLPIAIGLLISGVAATIGILINNAILLPSQIKMVEKDIAAEEKVTNTILEGINSSIAGLEKDVEGIETQLDTLEDKVDKRVTEVNGRVDELFSTLLKTVPTPEGEKAISTTYNGQDNPGKPDQEVLSAATPVAYSTVAEVTLTPSQVAGLPLLLPYKSGGQEVYFYGQFDENGSWDGHCLLNTYEDDRLVLITEANYDHGTLLNYRQAFFYDAYSGDPVWAFSNRVYEGDFNSGETWLYAKKSDHIKDFTFEDVRAEDILTPEEFWSTLDLQLYGYYHGNTSNGKFNDDTGDAYMVHFFEDGKVRLLYCGRFSDGRFNDNTGSAWYIVKEPYTDYMYFRGKFKDSHEVHRDKFTFENHLNTVEKIMSHLGGRTFDIDLEWDIEII